MTGSKKVDTILTSISTLVALGTCGVFYYTTKIYKKPLPSESRQKQLLLSHARRAVVPKALILKKVLLNLKSRTSRLRFLELDIHIIPIRQTNLGSLKSAKTFVMDSILDIGGRMQAEEVNSISGKILLENRIKKSIDRYFGRAFIKEIFFSRFVVQ